jgi:hypothetical protein
MLENFFTYLHIGSGIFSVVSDNPNVIPILGTPLFIYIHTNKRACKRVRSEPSAKNPPA